ncbi:hypothetical protein OCK74_22965 [Chitinophagaceae bacterium LB-8]|uniref:Uncharacterized protein n=1 Tax=Paraflavisolibacter caeni TaxID=2982496 RepID=A0A9X2XZC4_9BACT|nr:hypothetical protein [Paraflavisolibacter caeni]MCU7552000.1 hypothetical protein [Paraflavisolibacter caeni]
MKHRERDRLPQDKDRHLDTPQEANRDKHINFLDIENPGDQNKDNRKRDKETEERRKEWKQGIAEGKKVRNEGK